MAFDRLESHLSFRRRDEEGTDGFRTRAPSDSKGIIIRLRTNCGNIFGKQIGNVFVFTICFDVGLAVLC